MSPSNTLSMENVLSNSRAVMSPTAHAFTSSFKISIPIPAQHVMLHWGSIRAGEGMDLILVRPCSMICQIANALIYYIEKLSNTVRSASLIERSQLTPTPTTWDNQTLRAESRESIQQIQPRESSIRDNRERYFTSAGGHNRSDSEVTGAPSSIGYPETTQSGLPLRRHDYDVQAMESNLIRPPPSSIRNPIPPPSVSVRSEFPTINRSRQQQTLTCLITIEVTDNKWRPDTDDLQPAPIVPTSRAEEPFARPPSPAQSAPRIHPYESPEVLDEVAENLRVRVENWHGLDFQR